MSISLTPYLSTIRFHEPQVAGTVAVVQLEGTDPGYPPVTPYQEAHRMGLVEITELGGMNAVSEIRARNLSRGLVLILEGEVLVGAKQNRTVNASILLPPESTTVIPVSCVERGRWSGKTDCFTPSDTSVTPTMRKDMIRSAMEGMGGDGRFRADQARIWDSVAARMEFMNFGSPTENFADLMGAKGDDIRDVTNRFPRRPGAVGIVGFIGGKLVGCDIIPEPGIFAGYYDRLVKSYALDGLFFGDSSAPGTDLGRASEKFIVGLCSSKTETFPSPGLGTRVHLTGETLNGSALVHGGSMIHLGAFSLNSRRL